MRFDLPPKFRNQVIFIWAQAAGFTDRPAPQGPVAPFDLQKMAVLVANQLFQKVRSEYCETRGLLGMPDDAHPNEPCRSVKDFFLRCSDEEALDIITRTFNEIPIAHKSPDFVGYLQPQVTPSDAISKLNLRFQENSIGYRYEHGRIVRLDAELLYIEATEPALKLLDANGFDGALEEFHLAHKHYRNGAEHYDDCLTNCLKSLESTLKTICKRRNWPHKENDTASKLLEVVFRNELVPDYLNSHFSALRSTLESGVPTIRNREGGHGSGEIPNKVPDYLAAYQLHLTASAIVFLIKANEAFDKS